MSRETDRGGPERKGVENTKRGLRVVGGSRVAAGDGGAGVVIQEVGYNFNDGVSARRLLRIRVARNF